MPEEAGIPSTLPGPAPHVRRKSRILAPFEKGGSDREEEVIECGDPFFGRTICEEAPEGGCPRILQQSNELLLVVEAIENGDGDAAYASLRDHISKAYVTRLKIDAAAVEAGD